MPRDAGGEFSRTNGSFSGSNTWAQQAASADKVISSARHDTHDQDMADGLSDSLSRSGKGAMQSNLNLSNFKIENLANGTASGDAVNFGQLSNFVSSDTVNRFTEQQQWDKGADVVAAATLLTLTDGNSFKITGSTTIAGMTARPVGTWVCLEFDSSPTLTHGTDWFLNNNGENILIEPGDRAICIMATATQWQAFVQRATGQAIRVKDTPIPPEPLLAAHVTFNGNTGAILGTALNVSSVTLNSTGDYTVNFITNFSDANYGFLGSAQQRQSTAGQVLILPNGGTPTVSSCNIISVRTADGNTTSTPRATATFYGTLV